MLKKPTLTSRSNSAKNQTNRRKSIFSKSRSPKKSKEPASSNEILLTTQPNQDDEISDTYRRGVKRSSKTTYVTQTSKIQGNTPCFLILPASL
jgi:hypothetical protein